MTFSVLVKIMLISKSSYSRGSWRAKAAAQLPREWLESESIVYSTSTRKVTLEHGPYIARCPSRPIATLVFSSSDREVGFEKY